ncbi:MAG: hypothetical protein HQL99_14540 [Magnetococcales bacterium]|nr:hypothetical protein [Magnetococcales bacterium]
MSENPLIPLHVRSNEHDPEKPFDGDLFGRQELAAKLTGMMERMRGGCVFAIDAPWGDGKTWFGKNWAAKLQSDAFHVVFIDAFRQDFVEDPFLMLCAEVLATFKENDVNSDGISKLFDASIKVSKTIAPLLAKVAINIIGRQFLGSSDMAEECRKAGDEVQKGLADYSEKALAKRLADHGDNKRSVEEFAKKLGDLVSQLNKKPLIIIIDELDRCRPDFAVKTVERIKHFFDVPGVVFVLLVNRPQLEAAIRGIYGSDVDARTYLGKFIQLWLQLPKTRLSGSPSLDHNRIYCQELGRRFGLEQTEGYGVFKEVFEILASLKGLSLRDLERGYTLFSLAQPVGDRGRAVAWSVYLRLVRPDVHVGLLVGEKSACISAREELEELKLLDVSGNYGEILSVIDGMYKDFIDGNACFSNDSKILFYNYLLTASKMPTRQFIQAIARMVDLNTD